MDKILIPLIEAIIFTIPLVTLFIKVGEYKSQLEDVMEKTKDLPGWKAGTDEKINTLLKNDDAQQKLLGSMNTTLIEISTKIQLILESKIKIED